MLRRTEYSLSICRSSVLTASQTTKKLMKNNGGFLKSDGKGKHHVRGMMVRVIIVCYPTVGNRYAKVRSRRIS